MKNIKYFILSLVVMFATAGVFLSISKAQAVDPIIELCVKKNGEVRVIGSDFKKTECKEKDRLISINLNGGGGIGPQGPVGPTGPQGPVGPQGPEGQQGPQGEKGEPGKDGADGATGATGATGPQGAQGPQGPQGPAGPSTLTGLTTIISQSSSSTTATATCSASYPNVVGGGYRDVNGGGGQFINASYPSASNSWTVTLANTDASWSAYAVCSK